MKNSRAQTSKHFWRRETIPFPRFPWLRSFALVLDAESRAAIQAARHAALLEMRMRHACVASS